MKIIKEEKEFSSKYHQQEAELWMNEVIMHNEIDESNIISISVKNEYPHYGGYIYHITLYVREL